MTELAAGVALVTGASRGIGQAILHELAQRGAAVVGTATTVTGAERITQGLSELGLPGRGMVLDVTDAEAVTATVKAIEADLGPIGILVNNAGITRDNLLLRLGEEAWEAVLATNLTAIYRLCKACLKSMTKARCGRIVNIASVVAVTGNAGQTNYAASKAGMIGFTKSLAREVGARGVTVNAVAPGFIDTDMTRSLSDTQRAALLQQIPLGRFGEAIEVAKMVGFLASRDAAYISGETLHINGGMYMA